MASWWKTALGIGAAPFTGGASLIPSLIGAGVGAAASYGLSKIGGKNKGAEAQDPNSVESLLAGSAKEKDAQGQELFGQGSDAIGDAMRYLHQLTGNDPGAILAATAPERGRVMDQYDTARTSIAQFSPRGGGSASTGAQSYLSEASDLGDITANARSNAFNTEAQLGTQLAGLGLSAEQLASGDLNSILDAVLTREGHDVNKRGQNMEALGGLGQALGTILAAKFFKPKPT